MSNTETALAPWVPSPVEVASLLPAGIKPEGVNLLVPTMAIRQVNPYLVPDIEMVKLSIADNAGDVYSSRDMKTGHAAPTARALSKIANVAGVDTLDSRRIDDGRDPDVAEWRVVIGMRLPSGEYVRRAGTKRIDVKQLAAVPDADGKPMSPSRVARLRENLVALAETKAFNRALRSMLSLQGSMPKADLAKPFAVVRFVPNMSDPDVRRRMLDNLLPATAQAYGPPVDQMGSGATTIGAGRAPDVVEEAPDDEPVEAEFTQADPDTGEVIEAAAWGDDEPAEPGLEQRLRKALGARASSKPMSHEQRDELRAVFGSTSATEVVRGLKAAFDFAGTEPREITEGMAKALLAVSAEVGTAEFLAAWKVMAA